MQHQNNFAITSFLLAIAPVHIRDTADVIIDTHVFMICRASLYVV